MASYRKVLKEAEKQLTQAGIWPESAQSLMLELAERSSADLYRDYELEMPAETEKAFREGVQRLQTGEPLAYILGYTWFYGRKIKVSPDVLIPRPETEELCANVLADVDQYFPAGTVQVCDIGTGSGEIGITITLEEPRCRVTASDISPEAIAVAKKNAQDYHADITYLEGDMCQPFIERNERFDILISDPPYIPDQQEIDRSVKDFEPHTALFGGSDGLKFYRSIFQNADKILNPRSFLAFEIGWDQKEALLRLADEYFPHDRKEVLKDMEGKDRMLFIYRNL